MAYVYLLADFNEDNVYKIGVTRGSIERRIKKLQTGNANEIIITRYYETEIPFFIEKWLHLKFSKEKIRNEWFMLSDEQVFDFTNMCKEIEEMYNSLNDNPFFQKNKK